MDRNFYLIFLITRKYFVLKKKLVVLETPVWKSDGKFCHLSLRRTTRERNGVFSLQIGPGL